MFKRISVFMAALSLLSLLVLPAHRVSAGNAGGADVTGTPAAQLDASVLIKWMQLLYDRVQADSVSAPGASRLYAYAGVTAYQAVLPGIPEGISLNGQLTNLSDLPVPEESGDYDWPSSANAALSTLIAGLFPQSATDTQKAVKTLRDSLEKSRQKEVGADVVQRSMTYGDAVGNAFLDWSTTDNYTETRTMTWDVPTGDPSLWIPTAPGMVPIEPYWGQIRPFALYYADACAQKHNMPFSTDPNSAFYAQAMEVKTTGESLTNEQKDIARFWVDTPGITGTPAGHWVLIESQIIDVLGLKLDRSAMMYALVGTALGDSFISAWSLKYQVNLLRPVTYINQYIDPNWQPFIASPGFPEYPSGHSVTSGAAAEVLTGMFGTVAFTDRTGRRRNLGDHSYTSFQAAASQAAISRLYGGIHYREAIENGMRQGQCIGQQVLNYVILRSIPQGE
jgi:PAP2 superfamily